MTVPLPAHLLAAISPADVAAYLSSHGWHQSGSMPNAIVWRRDDPHGKPPDVIIPATSAPDASLVVEDAVRRISRAERRDALAVLADVLSASADVVRVRVTGESKRDGSIPLDNAALLFEGTRGMLMAAACSAVRPRASYPSRKPEAAATFVSELRMGHTERGSFIVPVIASVPGERTPEEAGQLFPNLDEPFARQATRMLSRGLSALRSTATASHAGENLDLLQAQIDNGVSANLCDAIFTLGESSPDRAVDISIRWASTRPEPEAGATSVAFAGDEFTLLKRAGDYLRRFEPQESVLLTGAIIGLDRPLQAKEGTIRLLAFIDNGTRTVRVDLGPALYSQAVVWHDQRTPVQCIGTLVRQGRYYSLVNVQSLEAVPSEDPLGT